MLQGRCKTCQAHVKLQRKGEKPDSGARATAVSQVSTRGTMISSHQEYLTAGVEPSGSDLAVPGRDPSAQV